MWTILLNLISGLADVLGKIFGLSFFKGFMAQISLPLMLTCDVFIIYLYISNTVIFSPIANLILMTSFLAYFRTSATVLFNIVRGNKKSTRKNQVQIGVVLNNSILIGIALGNLSSNVLPILRGNMVKAAAKAVVKK